MKKLILVTLLILSSNVFARSLIGTGIGTTEVLARKHALEDLSTQIEVTVESLFHKEETSYNEDIDKYSKSVINLRANNVLLGVEYEVEEIGKDYSAKAIISKDSLNLYEGKVMDLEESVTKDFKRGKDSKKVADQKRFYTEALKNKKQADTYRNIAYILGSQKSLSGIYTEQEIINELKKIEDMALDKAVVFFRVGGDFDKVEYKNYLEASLDKLIGKLANSYEDQLMLGTEDFNNIIIDATLNSSYIELLEPVYYNNKKLTDSMYKASITVTFIIRDTFDESIKGTFVISTNGKSFDNELKAMEKAISLAMRDSQYKLENYIEPFNY